MDLDKTANKPNMKPIREYIGDLIGQYIPENKWDETFKELNIQGWIDTKVTQQIIVELCKRIERLENENPTRLS